MADKVAFKTTDSSSSLLNIKNLLSEIKILSYIGVHENVIRLIGVCTDRIERGIFLSSSAHLFILKNHKLYGNSNILGNISVALEYCSLGSLKQVLIDLNASNNKFPIEMNSVSTCKTDYVYSMVLFP